MRAISTDAEDISHVGVLMLHPFGDRRNERAVHGGTNLPEQRISAAKPGVNLTVQTTAKKSQFLADAKIRGIRDLALFPSSVSHRLDPCHDLCREALKLQHAAPA